MDRPVAVEFGVTWREQSRARYPDAFGFVERDGVQHRLRPLR